MAEPLERRRSEFLAEPHQLKAITSEKSTVVLFGGFGSGKTEAGSIWCLDRAVNHSAPQVATIIAANSYTQLFDSTLTNTERLWRRLGVLYRPTELPQSAQSYGPLNLYLGAGPKMGWQLHRCRSLEKYQHIGGQEVGRAWLDEVYQTKKEAVDMVDARCRDKRVERNQQLFTTTVDDPSSWLYESFVERFEEDKPKWHAEEHWRWAETDSTLVVYASTYANQANLPADYAERLRARYSERMFERMVLCKWVSLEAGLVYYAFARPDHVSPEADFDPALPVIWCHDFNIGEGKPMSSALCQVKTGTHEKFGKRREWHTFDEIVLDSSDTYDACQEMKARGWHEKAKAGLWIRGDATGKARDTRSKTSDYAILKEQFPGARLEVPTANPPLRERHNECNRILRAANGDIRAKIHPRCQTLAAGLELTKLKKGAQYLEDDSLRQQHVTAAWAYGLHYEWKGRAVIRSVKQRRM